MEEKKGGGGERRWVYGQTNNGWVALVSDSDHSSTCYANTVLPSRPLKLVPMMNAHASSVVEQIGSNKHTLTSTIGEGFKFPAKMS